MTLNLQGEGSEQASKKIKVEEIDLTQDSSSDDDEVELIDHDMGEAEEVEQSEEGRESDWDEDVDEEEDLEDEDYTNKPARGSRYKRTSSTNHARGSRDPRPAAVPNTLHARNAGKGSQRRSSQHVSRDSPHPSKPLTQRQRQTRSCRDSPPPAPHRRHRSRERSPPGLRHRTASQSRSPSPELRNHHDSPPHTHNHHHHQQQQQYEEGEQAHTPRHSRHQQATDDVEETQGTSSRESQPPASGQSAPSPHPAPASNTHVPVLQQQVAELQRANDTLRHQYERMGVQNAAKQLQLRNDLQAMTVAHTAAQGQLASVRGELSVSKGSETVLRNMVQLLKREQEVQKASQNDPQQQQQWQQANRLREAQAAAQQAAAVSAHAAAQAASQQASQAAAAAAAQGAANAAANAAAQQAAFIQQQNHQQAWQKATLDHQEQVRQYQARMAAAAAERAAGYGVRGSQWSGPTQFPGGPSQHNPYHSTHGYYQPPGSQSAPRPAPAAPTAAQPQHSAAAIFATSLPPVLDATTRIPVLRHFLTQAGASEAMSRINEKDDLLAFALTKCNAWEIRRLVACSTVLADPGFSSTAHAKAFAYPAALRIPVGVRSDSAPGQATMQATYKELRIRVHPDKNPGDHATATAAFQFLQQANTALAR